MHHAHDGWYCQTMLLVEDINCICVDWKRGGRTTYTQAANNIRVVGAEVAYMIELFQVSIYFATIYTYWSEPTGCISILKVQTLWDKI